MTPLELNAAIKKRVYSGLVSEDFSPASRDQDALILLSFMHMLKYAPVLVSINDGRGWRCVMNATLDPGDTQTHLDDHCGYTVARRRVSCTDRLMCAAITGCTLLTNIDTVDQPNGDNHGKTVL